uniref:Secreted protein n=1 Tax=Ixodes ricinus TaxID=34613 RepID=A0A6B0ULK8_IXORI
MNVGYYCNLLFIFCLLCSTCARCLALQFGGDLFTHADQENTREHKFPVYETGYPNVLLVSRLDWLSLGRRPVYFLLHLRFGASLLTQFQINTTWLIFTSSPSTLLYFLLARSLLSF